MPKQLRKQLIFPVGGLHENAGYDVQPPGTSSDMVNMRAHDSLKGRGRGGKRGGSSLWYPSQINGSADIQLISKVVRPGSYPSTIGGLFSFPMDYTGTANPQLRVMDSSGVEVGSFIAGNNCYGVDRDASGNYYLCGERSTTWTGSSGTAASVWKLNSALAVQWTFLTRTSGLNAALSVSVSEDGTKVAVTGRYSTTWTGSLGVGATVWCLDASDGSVLWTADLEGGLGGALAGFAVRFDGTGNVFVSGFRNAEWSGGAFDANVWKLDGDDGTVLANYDTGQFFVRSLDINSSGDVLIADDDLSSTWVGGAGQFRNVFLLDNDLSLPPILTWDKHSGGSDGAFARFALDGFYYISGSKIGTAPNDVLARKFDSTGTDVWTLTGASIQAGDSHSVLNAFSDDLVAMALTNNTGTAVQFYLLNDSDGSVAFQDSTTPWGVTQDFHVTALPEFGVYSTRQASTLVVAGGTIKKITNGVLTTPTGGSNALTTESGRIQAAQAFGKVFFVDGGGTPKMYELTTDTVSTYTATAGTAPVDCRLICRYRGRIVQSGDPDDPHNWFASASGDPRDYDYSPATSSYTQAVEGNNAEAGLVGDIITALIPFSDDFLLFGGDSSLWLMANDPAAGGSLDMVSDDTGVAWGASWAKDPEGNAYFMGVGCIYKFTPGGKPVPLTDDRMSKRLGDVNMSSVRAILAWDSIRHGLMVTFLNIGSGFVQDSYFYDVRANAWLPDEYPAAFGPSAMYMYDSESANDRAMLLGTKDGYVLRADDAADEDRESDILCNARYAPMFDESGEDIVLRELSVTLAEGSGDCYVRVYAGQTAEQCALETTPRFQRTLTAGRNTFANQRVRGKYVQMEIVQDDGIASPSRFAVESASAVIELSGKSRRLRK